MIKKYVFSLVAVFLICITVSQPGTAQTKKAGRIVGRVVDFESKEPLISTNIFLSNTMLGTATDQNGRYEIKAVPYGVYELTVSIIGYKTQYRQVKVEVDHTLVENFYLEINVLPGEAISVTALDPRKRKRYLKRFKRIFLGGSYEELNCHLKNEETLHFEFNERKSLLSATAKEPLLIENRATGYLVTFVLDNFSAQDVPEGIAFTYKGRAYFKNLLPENKVELRRWEKNRLLAYHGSPRHFLTALANRDFEGSGFQFFNSREPVQAPIGDTRRKVSFGQILSELTTTDHLQLRFENYLEIVYHFEGQPQTSWIRLNKDHANIDLTGLVTEPLNPFTFHGWWAVERLTELLPREYKPVETAKTKAVPLADNRDYYREGVKKLGKGDWEGALDMWKISQETQKIQKRFRSETGFSFIELATAQNASDYYEDACKIYYWTLSEEYFEKARDQVGEEIERTSPLLPENVLTEWRKDIQKNRSEIVQKIKQFWLEKDPTPATILNERLIEHWERIAYAKEHFNNANSTPYGTDDRGLIYVKYGKPHRTQIKILGASPDELQRWGRFELPDSRDDVTLTPAANTSRSKDDMMMLRSNMARWNTFPECELWAYHNILPEDNENLIFIFGPRGGKGAFGLRSGIEDFIPSDAFHRGNAARTGGMLPGGLLQLMYYREVSAFDVSLSKRYEEIENVWFEARARQQNGPNVDFVRGKRGEYKNIDLYDSPRNDAPKERSTLDDRIRSLLFSGYRTRILNENNRSEVIFTGFAQRTFETALKKPVNPASIRSGGEIYFALIVRDRELEEIKRFTASPSSSADLTAVFRIDHPEAYRHFSLSAQSLQARSQIQRNGRQNMILVGSEHFRNLPPLETNTAKLESSDLVLGVLPPEDVLPSSLPFPLVPSSVFAAEDLIQVYFEVYHLKPDKQGMGRFSAEFRVIKTRKKGNKIKRRELVASKFEYTSGSMVSKEFFGVSTQNLKPGSYELEVEIKDNISGNKKTRVSSFEIIK